ncbi:DUF3079 domain-containing protein [Simplicispira piscis]
MAVKKFPQAPAHPERVCWGCDLYCPAKDMRCGNGSDRTPHPAELFGEDWAQWGETDATHEANTTGSVTPKKDV